MTRRLEVTAVVRRLDVVRRCVDGNEREMSLQGKYVDKGAIYIRQFLPKDPRKKTSP